MPPAVGCGRRLTRHPAAVIVGLQVAVVALLAAWMSPLTQALPQGAPETVCDTLLPFHGGGIAPQQAFAPYQIRTAATAVGQGQPLSVVVEGVRQGLRFGGFMLQARNRNPPYQLIGQFNPSPVGDSRLMNCENSVNNSVTHSNAGPKERVTVEWLAPINFLGEVVFNSTVAQTYDTFWLGVQSSPVQVVRDQIIITTKPAIDEPITPTAAPPDSFYNECGRSKTCFGYPDGCLKDKSCTLLSAVKVRGDIYEFELKARERGAAYVALGLSEDNKMGEDLVVECVPQNGRVDLYSSYTSGSPSYGAARAGVPQNGARLLQYSFVDGIISCRVERDVVTRVRGKTFDLVNGKYHLLLASGRSLKESGIGYHDIGRLPSGAPISLAVVQDLGGASTLLLRLHGAFMIAAWIGTTSLGILLARYFKQTWVGRQTCGKDQWFVWHRACMVTTWSLTMVAFVLIFVEIGAWSGERNPHAILGLITTILCFIQPIGALFRPAPNSKHRPIFNWAHWLGGNLAHILAIVTIFFAVKLAKAQLPDWMDWILVAYVIFHVIVHLIYSIIGCSADRQQQQRINTFQMDAMGHHHHGAHAMRNGMKLERKMDAAFAGFRKGLLAVYSVVLLLFVIALVLIVALAPIEQTYKSVQARLNE